MFLTHLHSDHTIGLPAFILQPWVFRRDPVLQFYGPPGTKKLVNYILEAYRDDIEERSSRIKYSQEIWNPQITEITEAGQIYQDDKVNVEAFRTAHANWEYTYAYRFTTPDRVVVFGGDGRPSEGLKEAAKDADVFVVEVATEKNIMLAPWGGWDSKKAEDKKQLIDRSKTFNGGL